MLKFPKDVGQGVSYFNKYKYNANEKQIFSGLLINVGCDQRLQQLSPHFYMTILFVGDVTYINEKGEKFQLKPGDLVFRHPYKEHTMIRNNVKHGVEFMLRLPYYIFNNLVGLGIIDGESEVVNIDMDQLLIDTLTEFIYKLGSYTPNELPLFIIETQKLFYFLNTRKELGINSEFIRSNMNKACQYLSKDFKQKLLIPELARKLGLGYSHFRKEFVKAVGISPKEYRIRKRIAAADNMLRSKNYSLQETAVELGYPDFASFAKQYKKYTGHSPGSINSIDVTVS